jgi:hypothetical protein
MREYWKDRMLELAQRGVPTTDVDSALKQIVAIMAEGGAISVPRSLIGGDLVLDTLCGCGLLRVDRGQITFTHQSYLDYQIASCVVREIHLTNRDICGWLGERERQSLFRREQLRQALCLLSEESAARFLESFKYLLSADNVRFNLNTFALRSLEQWTSRLQNYSAWSTNSPSATNGEITYSALSIAVIPLSFGHLSKREVSTNG